MGSRFGLGFHHLGLATRRPVEAMRFLEGLDYTIGPEILDPEQQVLLRMCTATDMPDVELVMATDQPGPVDRILQRRDAMMYHSCYTSSDVDATLDAMDAAALRVHLLAGPTPAVLFGGREVSFYSVTGFGVIELINTFGRPFD